MRSPADEMADPVCSVDKITRLGLAIKEAVETVHQHKEECRNIEKRVVRVSGILSLLKGKEMTETPEMRTALREFEERLGDGLRLIKDCQKEKPWRLFSTTGDLSKQLRQVREDISRQGQVVLYAVTALHITGNLAHVPLPQQQDAEVVGTEQISHSIDNSRSDDEHINIPAASDMSCVSIPGQKVIDLSELKAATNDFSDNNIIGTGDSAVVYKGTLHNGQKVAIKKFAISQDDDPKIHLERELSRSKFEHKNIVKPLGYYYGFTVHEMDLEGKQVEAQVVDSYLVEEYMPKGNLQDILKDGSKFDWSTRFRIIRDIANAVLHLYRNGIVHRDLVPCNILFDSSMNPKITDFGVATELPDRDACVEGRYVISTVGYIAPEVLDHKISSKVDVFSFGRIVLEIVGSTRGTGAEHKSSIGWAWKPSTAGQMNVDLFNPILVKESQIQEIERCIQIGVQCMQFNREDRPTMEEVHNMLDNVDDAVHKARAINQRKGLVRQLLCCQQ